MRNILIGSLITAFIIITIIAILFFSKEKQNNSDTRIYSGMIVFSMLSMIMEGLLYVLSDYINTNPTIYNFFLDVSKIFVNFVIGWFLLMAYYAKIVSRPITVEDSPEKRSGKTKKIMISYVIIFLVVKILPVEYIESGHNMGYTSGIATTVGFLVIIACLVSIIFNLIKARKHLNNRRYLPLILLVITMTTATLIQAMKPEILLFNSVISLVTFVMYHTIENPDIKIINQLEIAKEQADKANKAKTEFLSSMSHEIRTPLNAIVGFSDYIMTSERLEEAKENAQDIVNASNTLLEIVNGILDISKIESGKLEIINSKYTARKTFESLAKLITPKMMEKGLDFTYYIAPDIPETLYGDHNNIKKIVTNLLSNACKYTEKGFVRYEVNCINTPTTSKLIITVEDSGRGIKKESVDKLFTKFQRFEEDRNTTIEGTGLGLAITKQLIELMGGKIYVHTVYGEGSKFTVVVNQRIEYTPVEETKSVMTTLDLKDKRILIVDDNALNIKVATKILERYNANNIVSMDNGFECIERITSGEKYDLILLDDMMPKMSGVETFKKMKEIPGFNQPVVILTANAIAGMKEKYMTEGFDDYLAKPIEKDELIRVCNTIFAKYANYTQNIVPNTMEVEEQLEEQLEESFQEPDEKTEQLEIIEEVLEEITTPNNLRDFLKENNVDLDKALEFLGDMEMYDMTMNDYLSEVEEKWQKIINYKNSNDMQNYAVEVHSLKSDAKYLGFMSLAEIAYQHELKSKENDVLFVSNNFEKLRTEYLKVLDIAKKYKEMTK